MTVLTASFVAPDLLKPNSTIGVVLQESDGTDAVWSCVISANVGSRGPGQAPQWAPLSPPFLTVPPSVSGTPGTRLIALAKAPNGNGYLVTFTLVSGSAAPPAPPILFFQGEMDLENATVLVVDGVTPPGPGPAPSPDAEDCCGVVQVPITGTSQTLTPAELATGNLVFTGALTGDTVVTFPSTSGVWIATNETTGVDLLELAVDGTKAIVVPPGRSVGVRAEGANLVRSSSTDRSFDFYTADTASGTIATGSIPSDGTVTVNVCKLPPGFVLKWFLVIPRTNASLGTLAVSLGLLSGAVDALLLQQTAPPLDVPLGNDPATLGTSVTGTPGGEPYFETGDTVTITFENTGFAGNLEATVDVVLVGYQL